MMWTQVMDGAAERKNTQGEKAAQPRLVLLPAGSIRPNPYQPRRRFDEAALAELMQSIQQAGLIQPLVVRETARGYELIAGERRLRACRMLGMERIPCVVRPAADEDSALMALIENVQRQELQFFEEAECYRAVLKTYNLTQEALAAQLGKSQSFLANKLRLLHLSPPLRRTMAEAGLSERHARALLRIRDERLQRDVLEKIIRRGLNVKDAEQLVERALAVPEEAKKPRLLRLVKDYRLFVNAIKRNADQLRDAGMQVELVQTEVENGVDVLVKVRR